MQITKVGKKKITIELTDQERAIYDDSLYEFLDWLETLCNEKLANSKNRLVNHWVGILQREHRVVNIPTDDTALLALIFSQPDYKTKKQRDDETNPLI